MGEGEFFREDNEKSYLDTIASLYSYLYRRCCRCCCGKVGSTASKSWLYE